MTTVAALLDTMLARDLEDDLRRAATFPGGYRPCVRVMLQRHWSAEMERITPIAAGLGFTTDPTCTVNSLRVERYGSYAWIGVRDNRDRDAYDVAMRQLGAALKAAGLRVRHRYEGGKVVSTKVTTDPRVDALVEQAAALYLERLDAARKAA